MSDQLKLRVTGLPEDIEKFSLAINAMMLVLEESDDYQNRGNSKFCRRYFTVKVEPPQES